MTRRLYDFGPFSLDPSERRLLRDGKPVALTPKCFDLLVILVEKSGHLLGKDELLERLWPGQFVEEANLSFNISTLRKALGEGQSGRHFIETVPKKGFRFVAPVEERGDERSTIPTQQKEPLNQKGLSVPSRFPLSLKIATGFITASVLVYFGYGAWARRVAAPVRKSTRTIAVLPFKPLSSESRDESLEMGMAETLITKLSNINQLVVRPMSSVRKYSNVNQDPVKAGQELQTETVLDGSIQKAGDRVRVTVRLIDVKTSAPLMSESFDAQFTDILNLQDSISQRVTHALIATLSGAEREQLIKHATESPEAFQLYLLGQYLFFKQSGDRVDNYRKGLECFQKAVEKDPQFAPAYIGIAHFYINVGDPKLPRSDRLPKAKAAVLKALELDSELAEAHNALGELKYQFEFDWSGAEENFRRAIALDPNNSYFHLAYSWYLMCLRRFEESKAELGRAQELEPSSFHLSKTRGILMLFMRQYDEAIRHYQKLREMEPNGIHRNQWSMSVAFQQLGRYSEAVEEFLEDGRTREYLTSQEIESLRETFKTSGWESFSVKRINMLEEKSKKHYVFPTTMAGLYALAGDKDRAFAWLEKAIESHDGWLTLIKIQPAYDSLRNDSRYIKVLEQLNLTP